MKIVLDHQFLEDLRWWSVHHPPAVRRILALMEDTMLHPTSGLGEPTLLPEVGRGFWAREIYADHDLIYLFALEHVTFLRCRETPFE